ncbi:MAG: hypothetical protein KAI33_08605, partial [Elusimicrobiales bacterium]|nr:hypothetical protein [Elusimicrobiales bacterium]
KLEEAEKFIRLANDYDPGNAAYMDSLGWVYFKRGKLKEALKKMRGAIAILDNDNTMWDHLGEIYRAMKDYDRAWHSWKVSLMLNPKDKKIKEKFEKLETELPRNKSSKLLAEFLLNNSVSLTGCSSFAKIDLKIGSRKIKFDAVLDYKHLDSLKITVLGPLMTPVWEASYSILDKFEMGDIPVKKKEGENLAYWVNLFMGAVHDYFSGGLYFVGKNDFKAKLKGQWLETKNYKIRLGENMILANEIKMKSEKKANIKFSDFKKINKFNAPSSIELKAPFSKVKIKLTGVKFGGMSEFVLP